MSLFSFFSFFKKKKPDPPIEHSEFNAVIDPPCEWDSSSPSCISQEEVEELGNFFANKGVDLRDVLMKKECTIQDLLEEHQCECCGDITDLTDSLCNDCNGIDEEEDDEYL